MEWLQCVIYEKYVLDLKLKPFGDNEGRGNVFLGENNGDFYIIKIEDAKKVEQVKKSIKIAYNLLKSDLVASSKFLKTKSGEFFEIIENKVITLQVKEKLMCLSFKYNEDLSFVGEAIGEFHRLLLDMNLENLEVSDFYYDFMRNEIPLSQSPERLEQIKEFYNKFTPDYGLLSKGVAHNDLHSNNIFRLGGKYFFIDFEHLKYSPLISDLGVLILAFWDKKKGTQEYLEILKFILKGYEKKIKLTNYDKESIVAFSLRYLFSDENWYTYWSLNGNPAVRDFIPEIREKQLLLLELVNL